MKLHGKRPRRTKPEPPHGRHPSRRVVQFSIIASVTATIVLTGGFAYGTYAALGGTVSQGLAQTPLTRSNNATQPGNTSQSANPDLKTVHLVALGDSLAHGLGDASGQGFVGDVSQKYRSKGDSVVQSNFGIDGLTSAGLVNEVKKASVQSLLSSANVILVSIGGNDLNGAAGLPKINKAKISLAERHFATNLTTILLQIRKINKTAPMLLVGLYNPYASVAQSKSETDAIVQSWTMDEEKISEQVPNAIVVETFDMFQLHGNQLLYVDHFHPNQKGYQLIASRIWQDLEL